MRQASVDDFKLLLNRFCLVTSGIKAIDIGGTERVWLEGRFADNPLRDIFADLVFFDAGFTVNKANTTANFVGDFLDCGTITNQLNTYDFVLCFDTLEHVEDPFLFCENLLNILKPGGILFIATVFEWYYHPSPEDFWRFSPAGLQKLFTIRKNANSSVFNILHCDWCSDSKGVMLLGQRCDAAKNTGSRSTGDTFRYWLELISFAGRQLYYRDHSSESLQALHTLAQDFKPTVIVVLGIAQGIALRTWIAAAPQARIHAVDLSFKPLREYADLIPFELSCVNLIETNILRVEFAKLWNDDDRVLFFVDAHDLPTFPIMPHVLRNALPYLPEGSLVVVDDIWRSPETVDPGNSHRLFEAHVLREIDELLPFEDAHYAPYHRGGSFFGFAEVRPLLRYVNKHSIELHFEPHIKHVSFYSRKQPSVSEAFAETSFRAQCGSVPYHPLDSVDTQSSLGQKILKNIRELYSRGDMTAALRLGLDFRDAQPDAPGINYTLAVLLLRLHDFANAKKFLELEAARQDAHPNAERLYADVNETFFPLRITRKKTRQPGLTIFAAPKAFTGAIATIQKNAIASWMLLSPKPEIILFGDDAGIAEAAGELGVRHVGPIRKNEYNTPLVHALFQQAQEESGTELLAYINADIILFSSFMQGVQLAAQAFENFLLLGGRWDYDQDGPVNFSEPDWEAKLQYAAFQQGKPHAPTGMDYFVFRAQKAWSRIPPFALGRFRWDTWLLHGAVSQGMSVIDGTAFLPVAHQNHSYAHYVGGFTGMRQGVESKRNRLLAGNITTHSVIEASYYFDAQGKIHARCT